MEETPRNIQGGFLLPPKLILLSVAAVSVLLGFVLSKVSANVDYDDQPALGHSSPSETSEGTPDPLTADSDDPSPVGVIAPLFTPEVQHWEYKIITWSEDWKIDPNLIATVMQIESCGFPKANSGAGAMGLFQVMPFHFAEGDDPYKPNKNAQRGLSYLKRSLEARDGNYRLALAGYNGGIYGASQPESAWPAETLRYVYWGTGIYKDAVNGMAKSNRLDEWLAAGGASLCNTASEYLMLQ